MASQLLTPSPLLKPLVTLASWTFIQQLWMHTTRLRAITQHAVSLDPAAFDADLATKVPHATRRVADNYNHLHEQPTVFYAVVLALALAGDRAPATLAAAWAYVGVRVAHSVYQSTVNVILTRFRIFVVGSVVLGGLTGRLGVVVWGV